jgi:hypothetical protein
MPAEVARFLMLQGAIVVFLGVLAGFPFWLAIIRDRGPDAIRAWRVAHTTLIADGLLLLIVSLMRPHLALSGSVAWLLGWALVASAYGFVFALAVGAWVGERGLAPVPLGRNSLFFAGHAIGAGGAVVGAGLVLVGLLA